MNEPITFNVNKQITFDDMPQMVDQLSKKVDLIIEFFKNKKDEVEKSPHIDLKKACEILMVSPPTLYRYCNTKKINHFKKEKKLYFLESDLIAFIQSGRKRTEIEIQNETKIPARK